MPSHHFLSPTQYTEQTVQGIKDFPECWEIESFSDHNNIIIIIKVFISSQEKKYISHNIGKVNDRQGGGIT